MAAEDWDMDAWIEEPMDYTPIGADRDLTNWPSRGDRYREALEDLTAAVEIACGSRLTARDIALADKAAAARAVLDQQQNPSEEKT